MRLDKYIWTVRLYKTRSLATKACQAGNVKVNGLESKASKEIQLQDSISIKSNPIWQTFKILDIPKSRVGPKLVADFLLETTPVEDLELLQNIQEQNRINKFSGQKGRPTKKQRRDLDQFK